MDEANQDQPQVRRVGRPPKAKPAVNVVEPINGDIAPKGSAIKSVEHTDETIIQPVSAQVLAARIWDGQSPDLPRAERLARVKAGVEAQGLSMDGVTL